MGNIFTDQFLANLAEMTERNAHGEALKALADHIAGNMPAESGKTVYRILANYFSSINRQHNKTGYLTEDLYNSRRMFAKLLSDCILEDFGREELIKINRCL